MIASSPDIPGRFALLIAGLCRVVAAHIAHDRTAGAWITLVWSRLRHVANRIERLSAQIRAGSVPPLRAGFTLAKPRAPAIRPHLVLPRNTAWLVQAIPQAAVYGGHLRQLLDDPEMAALLAAAPQLASILRPLCRALGVAPPPRPPRPAAPAPASPEPTVPIAAQQAAGLMQSAAATCRIPRPAVRRSDARPVFARPEDTPAGHALKPA